jgi:hypothetical protein
MGVGRRDERTNQAADLHGRELIERVARVASAANAFVIDFSSKLQNGNLALASAWSEEDA